MTRDAFAPLPELVDFSVPGFRGRIVAAWRPDDLESQLARLTDPSAAVETIHWGRNYLYRARLDTPAGTLEVVVKQFRGAAGLEHLRSRARGGSKAERSFHFARELARAGVPTADAVALVESTREDGPSFFISRYLEGTTEARYILRARNDGRLVEEFPELDLPRFWDVLGRTLRRMHGAGLLHRDLSIGNVLLCEDPETLYIVDLNRMRARRMGIVDRSRDLCRLAVFRADDRRDFLHAYWQGEPGVLRTALYRLFHHGFHGKIATKKRWRALTSRLRQWVLPRRAHAHIPEAPKDASARDKIVWDHLSDQPHQHASRLDKLRVRVTDLPSHLRQAAAFVSAAPRIWRAYRRLLGGLYREPVAMDGIGVALRPMPEAPDALLAAIDELGVRRLLVRLHPWEEGDADELALVRELAARGHEIDFALPQNRELVRDPARWERRVQEIAERFLPYGRRFQVGQAVNRSKWGVWTVDEYFRLARSAAEILRREGAAQGTAVEILGPAVIDFEVHFTAALLNLPRCPDFDAVASLLYVDRRGAPENKQLVFDTVGKVALVRAIAETARHGAPRSWITEVNWPLREGPHSPAGRSVSVDEENQADYLVRFYLLALGTGLAERVYWWQIVARGYGLAVWEDGALRRRASFHALRTLHAELDGATFLGPIEPASGPDEAVHLYHFRRADGGETLAGWSIDGARQVRLPRPATAIVGRDGGSEKAEGEMARVDGSVRYFRLN